MINTSTFATVSLEGHTAPVLSVDLDNAGKTTILRALAHEEIHTVQPTQGFNVKTLQVANFRFNVWDLGGQMAIREHWSNYYDNLDCIIYVVDSSDNRRMEDECGGEL